MIPKWNSNHVLPPVNDDNACGIDRSPYSVSLCKFVKCFAASLARVDILKGFLTYRAHLHSAGIVNGFQWLDGSFVENIEQLELRAPHDIDVVTFFQLPDGEDEQSFIKKYRTLFHSTFTKKVFHVDAYLLPILGQRLDRETVGVISYWYSMWSHRRDHSWKGFIMVDLDPEEDKSAWQYLHRIIDNGELNG